MTGGLLQYRLNFNPVATLSTCGAIPLLPHMTLAVPVQCYQPTHAIRLTTFRLHAAVLFAKPAGRFVLTTCIYTCKYLEGIGCCNFVLIRILILGDRPIRCAQVLQYVQSELRHACTVSVSCSCCGMLSCHHVATVTLPKKAAAGRPTSCCSHQISNLLTYD